MSAWWICSRAAGWSSESSSRRSDPLSPNGPSALHARCVDGSVVPDYLPSVAHVLSVCSAWSKGPDAGSKCGLCERDTVVQVIGKADELVQMTLSAPLRKLGLLAHIVASVGWLGAAGASVALAVVGLTTADGRVAQGAYLVTESFG